VKKGVATTSEERAHVLVGDVEAGLADFSRHGARRSASLRAHFGTDSALGENPDVDTPGIVKNRRMRTQLAIYRQSR
jgi:hypothetical protein